MPCQKFPRVLGVRYLIVGMGTALIEGAPGTTEGIDLWFERSRVARSGSQGRWALPQNPRRIRILAEAARPLGAIACTCYNRSSKGDKAMPALDWSQCPAVESTPGKRSGAWVFKGTRTPVSTVFDNLQDMSVDELVEEFGVTREQVQAVLEFAAHSAEAQAR